MKTSYWDVVKFCLRHPTLLQSRLYHPHDKRIDALIEYLIDNIQYVKCVKRTNYYLVLSINNITYEFWMDNRYYAYLAYGNGGLVGNGPLRLNPLWKSKCASLRHAVAFYLYFDEPTQHRPVGEPEPASYILCSGELSE